MSRTKHILATTTFCVFLGACGTTSLGDNLGVSVIGGGSIVSLQWEELHSWDGMLARRGADLVAEYQTSQLGWVREVVSSGQQAGQRNLRFTLPPGLKGRASGPVCLYIQVRGNRNLLPVRKPAQPGEDTARFVYSEWEKVAVDNTARQLIQNQLSALEAQRVQLDTTIEQQSKALVQRGWLADTSCDRIQPKAADSGRPPPGIVPQDRETEAAKQVCVARMAFARSLQQRKIEEFLAAPSPTSPKADAAMGLAQQLAGQTARLAEYILELKSSPQAPLAAEVLQGRQKEARSFVTDWQAFLPSLQRKEPLLYGDVGNPATIISSAVPIQRVWLLRDIATKVGASTDDLSYSANEVLALGGAMLDSYGGCVDDARKELKIRRQTWDDLQRDSPERIRRLRDHYIQSCRDGFVRLRQIEQERGRLLAEIEDMRLRAAANEAAQPAAALAAVSNKRLNRLACQ